MKSSAYQNPWMHLLMVVLAFTVGYLYYGQTIASGYPASPPKGVSEASFLKFKDLKLDFKSLSADSFTKLKTYGDYPIQPGGVGREDIFSSY